MFSGIIESIGKITKVEAVGNGIRLHIRSKLPVAQKGHAGVGTSDREQIGLGDSIAIFGVCLTVEDLVVPDTFIVTCGRETVDKTILGSLESGSAVHLERALRVGDRLDGHLVQGHVDGLGYVTEVSEQAESWVFWIAAPENLQAYIAVKGSICINGVSLTVNDIRGREFRCNIIPHTVKETVFSSLAVGEAVNLEVDVIARYIERMLYMKPTTPEQHNTVNSAMEDQLRGWGYGAPKR